MIRTLSATLLVVFASIHAQAASAAPCSSPEQRQFDFWLGDWEVRDGEAAIAASRIERSVSDCVIRETYTQKDGYAGTSLNFYDPVLKRWRQTWVDSLGSVGEFVGDFSGGAMRFTGETHRADGARIHRKMRLAPEGKNVRQVSEASRDGATWRPHYDYIYVPRAP